MDLIALDLTGGENPFALHGKTSSFMADLESPVHGQRSPLLGSRMVNGSLTVSSEGAYSGVFTVK